MRPLHLRQIGAFKAGNLPVILLAVLAFWGRQEARAQTFVDLGAASGFSVLAGSQVTSTGATVVNGDLGVSPGAGVAGFPIGVVNGTIHANDGAAAEAEASLTDAYNSAEGQAATNSSVTDLSGLTLTTGVYSIASITPLTGTLTLSGDGVFIFQMGSTLLTAINSHVVLTNGAQAEDVFWEVGTSATLGGSSDFVGTIMAGASITLDTGAAVEGRLLAESGAVTLNTNVVTAVPEPAAASVLLAGFAGLVIFAERIRRQGPGGKPAG